MSIPPTQTITFQDSEVAIRYSTGWTATTWQAFDGQSGDFHFANNFSSHFIFSFPVPALGVEYWGFRRSKGGLYQACLDCTGQDNDPAWETIDALNVTDDGQQPPVKLWSANFSKLESHNLIVQNRMDPRANASQITLDRLVLIVSTGGPQSNQSVTSSTDTGSKSTPIGAIVGGAVGGVLGVLALGLLIWWLFRRRGTENNSPRAHFDPPDGVLPQHHLAPYSLAQTGSQVGPLSQVAAGVGYQQSQMQLYNTIKGPSINTALVAPPPVPHAAYALPPAPMSVMSAVSPSGYTHRSSGSESNYITHVASHVTGSVISAYNTPPTAISGDAKHPNRYPDDASTVGAPSLSPVEESDAGPAPIHVQPNIPRNPPSYHNVFREE